MESCSNKYCITGCAVNYTDWCSQPITDCGALGYTKTASQCPDGYLKCPYGETVFCPTVTTCNIGDIYYTDKTCSSAADYNKNKAVLGVVVYVTDGGKHGQIMAPWWLDKNGNRSNSGVGMYWSTEYTDVLKLPNMTNVTLAEADFDSCGNTDKIVAAGNASTYPAAWATRKYAPTTETAGKWCLPAAGILRNIQKNWSAIGTAVNKVGGASKLNNYWVWSSSETSDYGAWGAHLDLSLLGSYGKDSHSYYVVPVLEF